MFSRHPDFRFYRFYLILMLDFTKLNFLSKYRSSASKQPSHSLTPEHPPPTHTPLKTITFSSPSINHPDASVFQILGKSFHVERIGSILDERPEFLPSVHFPLILTSADLFIMFLVWVCSSIRDRSGFQPFCFWIGRMLLV